MDFPFLFLAVAGIGGVISQSFNASQPSARQDPYVSLSFASQLDYANPLAVLSGVFPQTNDLGDALAFVPSGWSFSIGFQPTTFDSSTTRLSDLFYWAALPDSAQLPDWLEFENDTLTFSGVAPKYADAASDSIYNATFEITVFCSLVSGRSEGAASTSFNLEIAGDVLTTSHTLPSIMTMAQGNVLSRLGPALMGGIRVNQKPLDNFTDISMDMDVSETPWLHWNRTAYLLSGTTPDALIDGGNFTLPCILRHGRSTLPISITVAVSPASFLSFSLPDLTVYPGVKFNVSYARFIRPAADTDAFAVALSRPLDWLHANPESLQFYGLPPNNVTTGDTVRIDTTSGNGTNMSSTATFLLAIGNHRPVSPLPQSSSATWLPPMRRGLIATIVLLPLCLAIIASFIIKKCLASGQRRLILGNASSARGRSHPKSMNGEGVEFEKRGSVRTMLTPRIDVPESARVATVAWNVDSTPRTPMDVSNEVGRVRLVTATLATGSQPGFSFVYDSMMPALTKYGSADSRSVVQGMGELPSMNFTTYFRSPQTLDIFQSETETNANHLNTPDIIHATPHSRTRSINSAYDSIPSWDSESTWAAERRRRPPSPAWRRGDLQPRVDGYTFFDYLEERGGI